MPTPDPRTTNSTALAGTELAGLTQHLLRLLELGDVGDTLGTMDIPVVLSTGKMLRRSRWRRHG